MKISIPLTYFYVIFNNPVADVRRNFAMNAKTACIITYVVA